MIYILCVAVLAAGLVLAIYLKREGERSWRERRQAELLSPVAEAFLRFQITVVDQMTPALREIVIAARHASVALAALGEVMREGGTPPPDSP